MNSHLLFCCGSLAALVLIAGGAGGSLRQPAATAITLTTADISGTAVPHAVKRERTRIARDRHDERGAKRTKISVLSELAIRDLPRPPEAEKQIGDVSDTDRALIRSLDEIVWAVNPKNDTFGNLANRRPWLGNIGGRCTVASEPGQGTAAHFALWLPLSAGPS